MSLKFFFYNSTLRLPLLLINCNRTSVQGSTSNLTRRESEHQRGSTSSTDVLSLEPEDHLERGGINPRFEIVSQEWNEPWFKYLKHISREVYSKGDKRNITYGGKIYNGKGRKRERNASTSLVEPWPFILPSPLVSHYRSAAKRSEDRSPPCIGTRKWHIPSLARACVFARTLDFRTYFQGHLAAVNIGFNDPRRRFASVRGMTRNRSQRGPIGNFFKSKEMWSSRGTVVSSVLFLIKSIQGWLIDIGPLELVENCDRTFAVWLQFDRFLILDLPDPLIHDTLTLLR